MSDETTPLPKQVHSLGQDITTLSINELRERINDLEQEIDRLKTAKQAKEASLQAAHGFFKT